MFRSLVAVLLLGGAVAAQNAVTTFSFGTNVGGWTFGANSFIDSVLGPPGNGFLHTTNLDTFAPQLTTTAGIGPYAGNWRTKGFTSVGVDLRTISTQFPFDRPLSLILQSGGQSVYFVGSDHVPQPGMPWKNFDFSVPSASTTMPAGWAVLNGGAPDATWNAVITNVTKVTFFYGDPTFFFIFDIWNVEADNIRASVLSPFTDMGFALPGTTGAAVLSGKGQLLPDTAMTLELANAPPVVQLVVGVAEIDAPFKGGVLVTAPIFIFPAALVPGQSFAFFTWPGSLPSGTQLYNQVWYPDAAGPKGWASSNGLKMTSP